MNIEYFEANKWLQNSKNKNIAKKNRIHGSSFDEFNGILKKNCSRPFKIYKFPKSNYNQTGKSRKSNFNIKNEKYILTTILAAESYHATFKAHTNHILTPEDTIGSTSVWKPWLESKLPWQCYFLWLCYLKTLDAVMAFVKKKSC